MTRFGPMDWFAGHQYNTAFWVRTKQTRKRLNVTARRLLHKHQSEKIIGKKLRKRKKKNVVMVMRFEPATCRSGLQRHIYRNTTISTLNTLVSNGSFEHLVLLQWHTLFWLIPTVLIVWVIKCYFEIIIRICHSAPRN